MEGRSAEEAPLPELTAGDRAAVWLLLLTGAAHVVLGVGAIAGLGSSEANGEDTERLLVAGLFSNLGVWGAVMVAIGLGEMLAARTLGAGSRNGWLAAQIAAFCGLGGVFFALGIYPIAGVVTIALGLAVHYLLTYHSSRAP